MSSVYKKELKGYFDNMTGYVFIAVIILLSGIFVLANNVVKGSPYFEDTLQTMDFVLLIVVPLITMNSFSLERRNKTDQLLLTTPVKVTGIVAGKYLAMITVLAIPTIFIAIYPLILSAFGTMNLLTAYSTLLAVYLLGCALMSIGMFISSLTESGVISAVASLGVMLLLYLMEGIAGLLPSTAVSSLLGLTILAIVIALIVYFMTKNTVVSMIVLGVLAAIVFIVYFIDSSLYEGLISGLLTKLALFGQLKSFVDGKFDFTVVVYYVSSAFLFGFLTVRSVDKRRWN